MSPATPATGPNEAPPLPQTGTAIRFGARFRFSLRLHHFLFVVLTIIAGTPIAVLALWEGNTTFQNELDFVRERHLLVARNLTTTLSLYVKDVEAVFGLVFESGALNHPVTGLTDLLTSLNVIEVRLLAPDGTLEAEIKGLSGEPAADLPPMLLTDLRTLASSAHGQIAISNLYHDPSGTPVFYLVKELPGGRLGLGVFTTRYLVSLQQTLAFGNHGHAVIVDTKGQVIAHPLKDWVAASRDISAEPVVAAMMRNETGVKQFYSLAFGGDMIAGYAVVPETGWGVMVAQPISELRRRANKVNEIAAVIALASFAGAALMAWLLALYLARPVRSVADTAEAVLEGNDEVSVPAFHSLVPSEIRRLGAAFNTMLDDQRRRVAETRQALLQAETSNAAKSQFLANMSHEIRTPMAAVLGYADQLLDHALDASERLGHVQTIRRNGEHLLAVGAEGLSAGASGDGRSGLGRPPADRAGTPTGCPTGARTRSASRR